MKIIRQLENYYGLVTKVDELCRRIEGDFREHLACRAGCDGCCRHLSLFWVEGIALAVALRDLPEEQIRHIRERARAASVEDPCPLLEDGYCLLYAARPLICRTHGLPLLMLRDEERAIDFCPLNFRDLATLPGSAVIDLEQLNTLLASINKLFVVNYFSDAPARERLSIAEALLLEL